MSNRERSATNTLTVFEFDLEDRGYVTPIVDKYTWRLAYEKGYREHNYPVPAIPLQVHWPIDGYVGMVYIDTVCDPDDPVMVCCWDFYDVRDPWYGKYQATYHDTKVTWYKIHHAWDIPECPCCTGLVWHKPCIIDLLKQ